MLAVMFASCASSGPASLQVRPSSVATQMAAIGIQGCQVVRAYTINVGDRHPQFGRLGIINGHLNPSHGPESGVELSPSQVAAFVRASATDDHPGDHARCFFPHHALIFFDAKGTILGHYTICFMCRGFRCSVGRFVREPDYDALSKLVAELKLPKP